MYRNQFLAVKGVIRKNGEAGFLAENQIVLKQWFYRVQEA